MDQLETQNLLEFMAIKNSDGSKTLHYPAFYERVPNEYKNFAEIEFGETPEKVSKGINYLTRFMEDKGLSKIDEEYLLAILRNSKYDLKKSKVKLEKFLRVKKLIAENVAELDFNTMDRILRLAVFIILPYRDKHGRLILVSKPIMPEYQSDIRYAFVCGLVLLLYTLKFPMTSLFGISYIGECKTPSIALHFQIMKEFKSWLRPVFDLPLAVRKVDVTNENFIVRWFMNFARTITPAKIFKRISLHGSNFETLKETFHPDLLPDDLEGNLGPMNCEHYRERLLDFMRKLREEHMAEETAKS